MISFPVLNYPDINTVLYPQRSSVVAPKVWVSRNQPKLDNNTIVEVRFDIISPTNIITKKYFKGFVKNQITRFTNNSNCIQYFIVFDDGDSKWMYLSKKNWKREMTSEEYLDSIINLQFYCKRLVLNKRITNRIKKKTAIRLLQHFGRRLIAKNIFDTLKKQDTAIRRIQTFSRQFSKKINNCSIKELAEITNLKHFKLDYVLITFAEQCDDDGNLTRRNYNSIMRTFIKSKPSWRQTNKKYLEIQVDKIFELYAERGVIDFMSLGTVMSILTKGSKKDRMRIICDLYDPYELGSLSKISIMDYLISVFTILFKFNIETSDYSAINMAESTVNNMFDNLKETDSISFDTFYNWMNNTNDLEKPKTTIKTPIKTTIKTPIKTTIKTPIKTPIKSQLRTRSGKTYNR